MKMFKKLMAVALAGVMALVVLTGCAASVNKKELVALLSDFDSIGSNKVEYKETSKDQANKVIDLVQKAYNNTKDEEKANFDPMDALRDKEIENNWDNRYKLYPEVKKALGIDDKTEDEYSFAIVELKKYSSQYNQDHATTVLATDVWNARKTLNHVNAEGNNGTVSINTVTLGSTEYLVVVFKVVA